MKDDNLSRINILLFSSLFGMYISLRRDNDALSDLFTFTIL